MTYYPTVGDGAQALDLGILYKLVEGNAVLSGLDVTIDSGSFDAADSLSVASGDVVVDGTDHSVSATNVGIDSASNNPRKDVVYVDGNGAVQVAKGQEAEPLPVDEDTGTHAIREHAYSPSPPDLSGMAAVPIAEIWVDNEASSLEAADIRDRRSPDKIPTAVLEAIGTGDLDFDPATQSELDSHAGSNDAHHAQDHASRHHEGGVDEIDAADLSGASGNADQILQTDGTSATWASAGGGSSSITASNNDGEHATDLLGLVEDTDDTTAFDETINTSTEDYDRIVVEFYISTQEGSYESAAMQVNGITASDYNTLTLSSSGSSSSLESHWIVGDFGASSGDAAESFGTATIRDDEFAPANSRGVSATFDASGSAFGTDLPIRGTLGQSVSSVDSVRLFHSAGINMTGRLIVWGRRFSLS